MALYSLFDVWQTTVADFDGFFLLKIFFRVFLLGSACRLVKENFWRRWWYVVVKWWIEPNYFSSTLVLRTDTYS